MEENHEQKTHPKCSDNDDNSLHRPRCELTGDDAGTLLGICVCFFILLASALAYFISIGLLVLVARALVCVWLYLRAY
jgi:hypothetical protein